MTTFTGTVAQMVESTRGQHAGWGLIYNDRMKDSRRSLKVRGWDSSHYAMAKALLEALGCEVEVTTTPMHDSSWGGSYGGWTRLHIWEPLR